MKPIVADGAIDLVALMAGSSDDDAYRHVRSWVATATEGAEMMVEVAERIIHSDPTAANRALRLAERLAFAAGPTEALHATATACYLRARLAVDNGRPQDAFDLIDRSQQAWLALDRPLDALRTELGRMHVLDDLGRHHASAEAAQRVLLELARLSEGVQDADAADRSEWLRAAALENLGVSLGFTGRYDEALDAYERAEHVYRLVGGVDDVARCQANRGVELVALGRAVEGVAVLDTAGTAFLEAGNLLDHAKCTGHAADAELLLGRYGACLRRCEDARRHLEDLDARPEACRVGIRTVRAYLGLNLVEEADSMATDLESELEDLGLTHDLAECRWLRGIALLRSDRAGEALERLDGAARGAEALDDIPLLVRVLLVESEASEAVRDPSRADEVANRAVGLVETGRWPAEELQVRLRLSELTTGGDSLHHLRRAEELATGLGLPHLRYPVSLALGRAARNAGEDGQARRFLQEAVDTVEGLRGLIADEALRSSYLDGRTSGHAELIGLLLDGGGADGLKEAFDLAERSKARSLADLLAGALDAPSQLLDTDDGRDLADLDAAYSSLITGGSSLPVERRRRVQRRALDIERRLLVARHRSAVTRGTTTSRPSPDLRHPAPGEQVVEYHVVDDWVVGFVWSSGRLRLATDRAPLAEVERLVADWERQVGRRLMAGGLGGGMVDRLVGPATAILGTLWELLLAPVLPLLDAGHHRLTVVPHGPLHHVPFHALAGPAGPMVRDWTITVAPSYQIAAGLHSSRRPREWERSVVIGVPDDNAPEVEAEARNVAGRLPGSRLLLGQDATVDRLRAELSGRCDVVHLACHGLHRPANPMFSALRLGDRWLRATDVLPLHLDRSLVVLSACESGRRGASRHRDEGTGLARSFLAAGAAAVVVSLWVTGDDVTAELMGHFYDGLTAGRRPAKALRRAQLSIIDRHPHPVDWAPFVVFGDH